MSETVRDGMNGPYVDEVTHEEYCTIGSRDPLLDATRITLDSGEVLVVTGEVLDELTAANAGGMQVEVAPEVWDEARIGVLAVLSRLGTVEMAVAVGYISSIGHMAENPGATVNKEKGDDPMWSHFTVHQDDRIAKLREAP